MTVQPNSQRQINYRRITKEREIVDNIKESLIKQDKLRKVEIPNSNMTYWVSPSGNVISESDRGINKILKPYTRSNGYMYVNILDNSRRNKKGKLMNRTVGIHRLVAAAYLLDGDYSAIDGEINHFDKDPTNNNVENLEITDKVGNHNHRACKLTHPYTYIKSYKGKKHDSHYVTVNGKYLGSFRLLADAADRIRKYFNDNDLEMSSNVRLPL